MNLKNKTALVAGATRGAGRAIAVTLGQQGATVYCTGRSTTSNRSDINRPETIQQTADLVTQAGGKGIPVQTDHTIPEQVHALIEKIKTEQNGKLDILINDIWGGEHLTEWDKSYWQHNLQNALLIQQRAVHTHIITSHYATPLLINNGSGLIIEVTDGTDYTYRGNLYYSLAKIAPIHLATGMATELAQHNIAAIAVTPGFLRSEQMLDHFNVTEQNWQEAIKNEPHFAASETPYYLAKGIAALAADPNIMKKTGQTIPSWHLARQYGYRDIDGTTPDWGQHAKKHNLPFADQDE